MPIIISMLSLLISFKVALAQHFEIHIQIQIQIKANRIKIRLYCQPAHQQIVANYGSGIWSKGAAYMARS